MRKKAGLCLTALLLAWALSGCVSLSAEDAYQLPKPPAEYENLMSAIAQTKKELAAQNNTSVEDVAPTAGENTSAVQLLDMDSDGQQETAVTFLRAVGAQMPIRICFYELQEDDSYHPSGVIMGEGDSIFAVRYADVDGVTDPETGKTRQEIVVNWQMGSNAYYLGVYALDDGEPVELAATAYQAYQLADLDENGLAELAVCHIDAEQQTGQVEIYSWNGMRARRIDRVPLSAGMTAVTQMSVRRLSGTGSALCVVGTQADDSRTVDLIVKEGDDLRNLTLDEETGISREHIFDYRENVVSDVNGDGASEIARPWKLPVREGAPEAWAIDWVQYKASGAVSPVCTTYHNTADGWYLILPDEWRGILTVHRGDSVPGQRAVVFSRKVGQEDAQPFLSIYKFTGANRNLRAVSGGRFILAEDSSTVYAAAFLGSWNCGLDENGLLDSFRLIVSSWSGE